MGSSQGRSFLAPEIAYLAGWIMEAHKRETGSIGSEGDLRDGSGDIGSESAIPDSRVSPKLTSFSLSLECHLMCKFRRIHDLRLRIGFLNVTNSVSGTFLHKLSHFNDLGEKPRFSESPILARYHPRYTTEIPPDSMLPVSRF